MYCSNCGKQVPDDSRFCENCGFNLIEQAGAAVPSEPVIKSEPEEKPVEVIAEPINVESVIAQPVQPEPQPAAPQYAPPPPPPPPVYAQPQPNAYIPPQPPPQPAYAPFPQGQPQQAYYQQPPIAANPELTKPMSLGSYMLTYFLLAIPLVGFILLLVWSFGSDVNLNKKNMCRSILIYGVIGVVFSILLSISIASFVANNQEALQQIFEALRDAFSGIDISFQ